MDGQDSLELLQLPHIHDKQVTVAALPSLEQCCTRPPLLLTSTERFGAQNGKREFASLGSCVELWLVALDKIQAVNLVGSTATGLVRWGELKADRVSPHECLAQAGLATGADPGHRYELPRRLGSHEKRRAVGVIGVRCAVVAAPGLLLIKTLGRRSGWSVVFDERWIPDADVLARGKGTLAIQKGHPLSIIVDWDFNPRIGSSEAALAVARRHLSPAAHQPWYDPAVPVPD